MSGPQQRKFIIGLTGNIATGKSAVLRMAAERGALTLDADKLVHDILNTDASMQAAIAVAFGEDLRRPDGSIDRAALGAIVFNDEQALRDLEHLVHPAVRMEIRRHIEASEAPVVMVEAIKLLEGELAAMCDQIWVTRCPRRMQERRLIICRGLDAETAAMRIDAQNPQEAKIARADVVIDTDGTMVQTREQFERAWARVPGAEIRRSLRAVETVAETTDVPREQPSLPDLAPVAISSQPPDEQVLVRRARPSDIPALLLLMQRATKGRVHQSRADLLRSFSERSYLIGQIGTDVVCVVGWNTDSTTAVCIDQVYAHPTQVIATVGPALLQEIERSARELICEVVLIFLAVDAPAPFRQLLQRAGYVQMLPEQMRRAWRRIVEERQPKGSAILGKILRDVRVA